MNYTASKEYWLVTISGHAWGLPSQTLGADSCTGTDSVSSSCTYVYRGLTFGLTNRAGWSGFDPNGNEQVWKLWDAFNITDSTLVGWWDPQPLIIVLDYHTEEPISEVVVTIFARSVNGSGSSTGSGGSAELNLLLCVASWEAEDVDVTLSLDTSALHALGDSLGLSLKPQGSVPVHQGELDQRELQLVQLDLAAPQVDGLQNATSFTSDDAIPVRRNGGGWLLLATVTQALE